MTTRTILIRAVLIDDDQPDDVCPGCGQDITGWRRHEAHYRPGVTPRRTRDRRVTSTMPFTSLAKMVDPGVCEWDHDYLSARAIRRHLIREGVTC